MAIKWRIGWYCGLAAVIGGGIGGCAQLGYYMQAAQGQFSLMSEAKPIDDWLADPGVADKLKDKLARAREIRRFAARDLGLPDNGTFTSYADLQRPYVLWNVVATPSLSMTPRQWCFPIAGCVNYRGYYSRQEAQAYAAELRSQNYDVQVSGVPAYSTLGWFNDPVLSTFVQYPESELARLMFHELAHQVAYAPGDSRFNESFAVAVEEAGVERWLRAHGDERMRASHREHAGRKQDFLALLLKSRKALETNYASSVSDAEKSRRKAEVFQLLQEEYQSLKDGWGGYAGYDRWFSEPLSNAHLALVATYHDYVPEFRALLNQEKSLDRFYAAVRILSALEPAARHRQLVQFSQVQRAAEAQVSIASREEPPNSR